MTEGRAAKEDSRRVAEPVSLAAVRRCAQWAVRILAAFGVLFLALVGAACWWRRPLATWVLRNTLADAGVAPDALRVTKVGPREVAISPLEVAWRGQRVRVEAITLDRPDLFSRSLGHVKLEGITVVLNLGALRTTKAAGTGGAATMVAAGAAVPSVTFDDLSVNGRFILEGAGAGQSLAFRVQARPDAAGRVVQAKVTLDGPGLHATGRGSFDRSGAAGDFEVADGRVDLAAAGRFLEQFAPGPLAGWELGGNVGLAGRIHWDAAVCSGAVAVHLRDGVLRNSSRKVAMDGIAIDLASLDPTTMATPPAQLLTVKTARFGEVEVRGVDVRFQMKGLHRVWIEQARAGAFGGSVAVEPFGFDPTVRDYGVTLKCESLRLEDILALFPTANAKASGLADGLVPVHIGSHGVSFSHGWLVLKSGESGTLQINEPGLLTGNLPPQSVAYPTLKAVESGLLNLRVNSLRAEVYPPGAPAGRSVEIAISGEPLDPKVKAPVSFEINVNGPVEKLIQWGLDSRVKFSTK